MKLNICNYNISKVWKEQKESPDKYHNLSIIDILIEVQDMSFNYN